MPGGSGGAASFDLDGSHLRVDALQASLVSLVAGNDGRSTVTVQPASGEARSEELPSGARQATFRIREAFTVEATATAAFVALAGANDERVVIAYAGEVTVVPGGDDRFALGSNEALVVEGTGTAPIVVDVAELTSEAYPGVAELVDAAADAAFGVGASGVEDASTPSPPAKSDPNDEAAPGDPTPPVEEVAEVAGTPGDRKPSGAAKAAKATKTATPPGGSGSRRKKGKKGRPQPQRSGGAGKVVTPAAATAAASTPGGGAGGKGGGAAGGKGGGKGGGHGGGGHDGDSYEDTPRDRRFLVGAVLVALVLAVGAVLLLSSTDDDGDTEVASESTTTEPASATTTTSTVATTTSVAPTTSTSPTTTSPTTSAPSTTAPTTTAPAPRYEIEPKSCVQDGASITYVATVRNTGDQPYDFTVEVAFVTPDGSRVAEATASVSRLGPGRSADLSATGRSNRDLAGSGAQCQVTRFDASPSD